MPAQGFSWGERGPAALALSRGILRDATETDFLAERLSREFTWDVVARLPDAEFRLTRTDVLAWLEGRDPS